MVPFVVALAALVAITLGMGDPQEAHAALDPLEPGTQAIVRADGDCLRIRSGPGLSSSILTCVPDGTLVDVRDGIAEADGFRWQLVLASSTIGWAADAFLEPFVVDGLPQPPAPPVTGASTLPVPPAGGLTFGTSGTIDPATLVAGQSFEVQSLFSFNVATQTFRTFIPGAPAIVNTLSPLNLGVQDVVIARRAGAPATPGVAPTAPPGPVATSGVPRSLPTPPWEGALTIGVSGTNDPAALAAGQLFPVTTISLLDTASQQWLTFIPGAPAFASSLVTGILQPDSVVVIRRGSGVVLPEPEPEPEPDPEPPTTGATVEATVTYYYCTQGAIAAGIGDGGGFCGVMVNGQTVFAGAAGCVASLLGQRFRITGDPTGRVYTCTDTGSAVVGQHRDIWFPNSDDGYLWWIEVGFKTTIEVLPD